MAVRHQRIALIRHLIPHDEPSRAAGPARWRSFNLTPMPMSDEKAPDLTAAERRMLIHGSPNAKEHYMAGRSRAERRRLERTGATEAERERRFRGKLTTREDVIRIMHLYIQQKILPLAANVDANTAALEYLTSPWHRRRLMDVRRFWRKLIGWLSDNGIRFRRLDTPDDLPDGETDEDPSHPDRSEPQRDAADADP